MARVGVYLNDDLEKRLKDYTYRRTGTFRGMSVVASLAIEEYLDRHEKEIEISK